MDGLEATVIQLSDALQENSSIRIDSEYFKKRYLQEDQMRGKFTNKSLGEIAFITDGQHGYHEVDETSSIVMLTA